MWVSEGVLDGEAHVGEGELSLYGAILELHEGVDDALRVDVDVDLRSGHIEEPSCLDSLEPLVHHRGGVDSHFGTHIPVGVVQSHLRGHGGELLAGHTTEGASAGGEDNLAAGSVRLALQTLEDGGVLGVDWENWHTSITCRSHDDLPSHDEGLLVGEGDSLVGLYGSHCGAESTEADHGGHDDVYIGGLHGLLDSGGTGEDFYARAIEKRDETRAQGIVGYDDTVGA